MSEVRQHEVFHLEQTLGFVQTHDGRQITVGAGYCIMSEGTHAALIIEIALLNQIKVIAGQFSRRETTAPDAMRLISILLSTENK